MKPNYYTAIRAIEQAFNANREAHSLRDRAIENSKINFGTKTDYARISRFKKEDNYKLKNKFIRKAINNINEYDLNIEYGQRDGIMYFKYKNTIISFHIFGLDEIKQTDIKWDGIKHKTFPTEIYTN